MREESGTTPKLPTHRAFDGVTRLRRGVDTGLKEDEESSFRDLAFPSPLRKDATDGKNMCMQAVQTVDRNGSHLS